MAEQPRPGDQQPPGPVEKEPGFMTDFIPPPSGPSLVVSVGHRLGHLACDAEIARLRAQLARAAAATALEMHELHVRAVAEAVRAERDRIRQLAERNQAVCTGNEGTSCYFADLIREPS